MSPPLNSLMKLPQYKTGHSSDRYWRMPNYVITNQVSEIRQLLKSRNYPHTGPASDFQYLLQCIARSLPGYEKCKIAELRQFAQQRGLSGVDKADGKQLVEALRLADKNPRFDRFLDLLPELRGAIYRLYCADFANDPLTLPTYPPLARANRQLRDEVLPVFYSECTFAVGLTTDITSHAHSASLDAIPRVLRMQRDTTLFFKSLSPENLAHVQRLEVSFDSQHPRLKVETFRLRVVVPRCGKRGTVKVSVHRAWEDCTETGMVHPWTGENVRAERLGELEKRVVVFVEGIQRRGEDENHLLVADVYRLRSILEAFFGEQ